MVLATRDVIGKATGRKGLGVASRDAVLHSDLDLMNHEPVRVAAAASEVSMRSHVQRVRDQLWFNRCFGSAVAGAIEDREAFLKRRPVHISDDFIYALARSYAGTLDRDDGSDMVLGFRGVTRLGAATVATHPIAMTTAEITRPPSARAHEDAHDRQGGSYYVLHDRSASGIMSGLRATLSAGIPIVVASPVYRSWQRDAAADSVIDLPAKGDPEIGWHAYRIVSVHADDTVEILNSWGRYWRNGGFARMSRDFVVKRIATFRAVDGWRALHA